MTATSHRVSILGLGLMGSALAEALLNAGHEVTVWNRTAGKADPLTSKGARAATSVAEALSTAEVTIICVSDHAATMEILGSVPAGAPADRRLLVQLSTMSADDSRELARWAELRGAAYLEGSIFGLPTDITGGSAMIVYSGPRQVFDASEALLGRGGLVRQGLLCLRLRYVACVHPGRSDGPCEGFLDRGIYRDGPGPYYGPARQAQAVRRYDCRP
jgi:3-hydroxyisobutyrate dehydrogenase-like beta-hydroxyacid dehydrogenase